MIRYINMGLLVLLLQTISMAGPTAQELLDKFTETVDKAHTSFITKSKVKVLKDDNFSEKEWAYLSGKSTKYYSIEIRTDGERVKQIQQRWGDMNGSFLPENEKTYASRTYGGEEGYKYSRFHDDPGRLVLKSGAWKDFTVDGLLANKDAVSGCFGYLRGDYVRFDHILEKAGPGRVTVRDKMEELNGTAHYVIDAKTNRGQYTVWLNPEKGYNFSKATVLREAGDFYMKDYKIEAGKRKKFSIENIQFTEVDGVWVPVKAKLKLHDTSPTSDINTIADLELTLILIDPDHDALDSFSIDDIRDGAEVKYGDKRPGKYIWRDGKVMANVDEAVIAELDRMAEEIMAEKTDYDTNAPSDAMLEKKTEIAAMTVVELLNRYRATQESIGSFIAKSQSTIEKNGRKEETASEFRFDGNRVNHRSTFRDGLLTTKEKPGYKSFLWDGKRFVEFRKSREPKNSRVFVKQNDLSKNEKIAAEYKGAALLGFLAGDSKRVDLILSKADSIRLADKTANVKDSNCFVIEATVNQNQYKIWLDPQHGYNITRAEVQKVTLGRKLSFLLDNVRCKKIDNLWVPMEADMEQTEDNGTKITKLHHKRTEMVLNPDFEASKAFVPDDIPDGVKVLFPGVHDRTEYKWQNGKPVTEADNNVKH